MSAYPSVNGKLMGGSREAIPEIGGEKPIKIPEEILTVAKAAARKFGRFGPMLFVDGSKRKIYTPLPFGETNDQRVGIMTQAGMDIAKSRDIGDVVRVVFVSEAWVSPARKEYVPPSQDLDRMEVLLFNVLDAQTSVQYLEMYSCVRNRQQEITDLRLVPMPEQGTTVDGNLLPAFLAGFRLFKR